MLHYKDSRRGFTLIELLVVIAIIGILSSIVLASLNTARSKGNDAAIKANLATISVQAELYYDGAGAGTYGAAGSSCSTASSMFADATIAQAILAADSANGSGTLTCQTVAGATPAWAVSSTNVAGSTWCVDSRGTKKVGTASGGACP